MHFPRVIVLILSYNGKHLLDDSVSSYLANDYPNFEVVVIDNGSTDGTKLYLEENYPEVTVIRIEKNYKYSGGFNFGLDFSFNKRNADFVLVTNNDVKADKRVISELVNVVDKDPQIGFVTGKVYYFNNPDILQTVGKYEDTVKWNGEHIGGKEKDIGQYDKITERFFVDDIYMMVSNKLYCKIGGYDETFSFDSEEYDWQARGKNSGYKIMYTPNAKIWHKESMTHGKNSALITYYSARNPMIVILKYKSQKFFRKYFWWHFKFGVLKSSLVLIKQLRPKLSIYKWLGFISGLFWGLKNRRFTFRHFF